MLLVDQHAVAGALVAHRRGLPWAGMAPGSMELARPYRTLPRVEAWIRDRLAELWRHAGLAGAPPHDLRFSPHLLIAFTAPALAGPVDAPGPVAYVGPAIGAHRISPPSPPAPANPSDCAAPGPAPEAPSVALRDRRGGVPRRGRLDARADAEERRVLQDRLARPCTTRAHDGTRTMRIGGGVVPASIHQHGDGADFDLTEGGVTVHVHHVGNEPELFKDCAPVVAEGHWSAPRLHDVRLDAAC